VVKRAVGVGKSKMSDSDIEDDHSEEAYTPVVSKERVEAGESSKNVVDGSPPPVKRGRGRPPSMDKKANAPKVAAAGRAVDAAKPKTYGIDIEDNDNEEVHTPVASNGHTEVNGGEGSKNDADGSSPLVKRGRGRPPSLNKKPSVVSKSPKVPGRGRGRPPKNSSSAND